MRLQYVRCLEQEEDDGKDRRHDVRTAGDM
jgi:hypothetical protein